MRDAELGAALVMEKLLPELLKCAVFMETPPKDSSFPAHLPRGQVQTVTSSCFSQAMWPCQEDGYRATCLYLKLNYL